MGVRLKVPNTQNTMTDTTRKFSTIAFDLDGTLAESKSPITASMSELLCRLLAHHNVAVVSGGSFVQFQKQLLGNLVCADSILLEHLFLFPTNGSALHVYKENAWHPVYQEFLTLEDKILIEKAWDEALAKSGVVLPVNLYGLVMEDRGTQITFSACGQDAPISVKSTWDPDQEKRNAIRKFLLPLLPGFSVSIGGTTSIDVTREGIDKAYAMEKIMSYLNIGKDGIMFVGDKLEPGGNDYAARRSGVTCVPVSGPDGTAALIGKLLAEE